MTHPDPNTEAENLQASGFLLPPVLSTEDIRRALGLGSRSAVVRLHKREGLPLARVGRRYVVTRHAFQRWLDERAEDRTPAPEPPPPPPKPPEWAAKLLQGPRRKTRGDR